MLIHLAGIYFMEQHFSFVQSNNIHRLLFIKHDRLICTFVCTSFIYTQRARQVIQNIFIHFITHKAAK